ncbi:MAG: hypothetical protein LLH30_03495 [Candidatus Manganitrophus sp. SA1]|nr:hypothetical protein [Candidatus Manganitrophus morganii]
MKKYYGLLVALLFCSSCAHGINEKVRTEPNQAPAFGPPANVGLLLSTTDVGAEAVQTLTFDVQPGDFETYQAVITYPAGFTFNGFGTPGTQVGSFSGDFFIDQTNDFTIPVFSIDDTTASTSFGPPDALDPAVDIILGYSTTNGKHIFTITIPLGGDGNATTVAAPFAQRLSAVINAGILTNPATSGTYTARALITSVDPDNDGPNDQAGEAPASLNFSQDIAIGAGAPSNTAPAAPDLVFPADGETGVGTAVTFKWNGTTDPEGETVTYQIRYCPDADFNGCDEVNVASSKPQLAQQTGTMAAAASLLVMGVVLIGGGTRRGKGAFLIAFLIVAGMVLGSCGGGGGGSSNGTPQVNEVTHNASNLSPQTTYFWKVIAEDSQGKTTESAARSFTTQ